MPTSRLFTLFLTVTTVGAASSQIRVRLYDYAAVSVKTVEQAKAVAAEVLATAGVDVSWAECPASPACAGPVSPSVLQVRIIDEQMAKRAPVTRTCLGYAVLAGGYSSIASVFYHKALELEKGNLADRSVILGAMLAHEIGHLLLGKPSHSPRGIMRGVWDDQDLKQIAKGRMWFTADEAAQLATNTVARAVGAITASR